MTDTTDQPSAGRLEGRAHLLPVRVYYEDTDLSGRVYHARYLHFMERARTDFLRVLGIVQTELMTGAEPAMFAIARMTIEFRGAARLDDALTVRTTLEAATGARLIMTQAVMRGEEVLVEAEVVAAGQTPQGRPRRTPQAAMQAIAASAPPGLSRKAAGVPKKS
jgi:acyl-CoA thioester hydrolase